MYLLESFDGDTMALCVVRDGAREVEVAPFSKKTMKDFQNLFFQGSSAHANRSGDPKHNSLFHCSEASLKLRSGTERFQNIFSRFDETR